ncbi:MAG: WD40 repeat domain-containing protein [Daejeonella sp.]
MKLKRLLFAISTYFLLPFLSYSQGYNYTELKSLATENTRGIYSVVYSPDGKCLASSSNDAILKIWDISTGKSVRTFKGHTKGIWSIAFSPNGKYVASSGYYGELRLWDISTGKCIHKFKVNSKVLSLVAFSPDGKYLVSGSVAYTDNYDTSSANALKMWDISNGKCIRTFTDFDPYYFAHISSVTYSPDGKYLATHVNNMRRPQGVLFSEYSEIKLWDVITGQCIRVFRKPESKIGFPQVNFTITFSPDGKYLASDSPNATEIWEISTGLSVRTFPFDAELFTSPNPLVFSPDGKYLASSNYYKTLNLWDISTGKDISSFKQNSNYDTFIAFSPDWKYMASVYQDSVSLNYNIKLWERNK